MSRSAIGLAMILAAAAAPLLCFPASTERAYSPEEVSRWALVGVGSVQVDGGEKAVRLSEGKGSKGITLVSRESCGRDLVVRFAAKPLHAKGVNVVLLAVSDKQFGGLPSLPDKSDGAMDLWTTGSISNYMAAFHTGFHQPNAYIRRNPGGVLICEAQDVATAETWYDVEVGRKGAKLWLKIDGALVCEGEDQAQDQPGAGAVGFRLRGPGDGTFGCLIRDVRIITDSGEMSQN